MLLVRSAQALATFTSVHHPFVTPLSREKLGNHGAILVFKRRLVVVRSANVTIGSSIVLVLITLGEDLTSDVLKGGQLQVLDAGRAALIPILINFGQGHSTRRQKRVVQIEPLIRSLALALSLLSGHSLPIAVTIVVKTVNVNDALVVVALAVGHVQHAIADTLLQGLRLAAVVILVQLPILLA